MTLRTLIAISFALLSALGPSSLGADGDAAAFPKIDRKQDWPWWRGPERNGTVVSSSLPTKFGESENVLWKVPVPGRGHSSPIVVGGRIFLETADEQSETQSALAFDLASGKQLWSKELSRGGFPQKNHEKNTEATPTMASDGERLFAVFFHHKGIHLSALSLDGDVLWEQRVGDFNPKRYEYGYAPSPLLYRDMVIVAAEHDGDSYIAALRRTDGKEVWRIARPQNITFSTPVIGRAAGKDQLLISGSEHVAAYDPIGGKQLWRASGTTAATCGTMVWSGDIVMASGGYPKSETLAIRADGSGKVLWRNNQKCYEQSMIVSGDYLYALTDGGIAYCFRITDGKEMWKERLRGPVSASPILSGGNIYWANELGTVYVFAADPKAFRLIAENRLGDETMASPAVSGDRLIMRYAKREGTTRQEYLINVSSR